jgi:ABC-2 type transport system permease protein
VLGLGALAIILTAVSANLAADHDWPAYTAAQKAMFQPVSAAFVLPAWLLLMLTAGSVGALAIVSEHASGLIRVTFTAGPVPRGRRQGVGHGRRHARRGRGHRGGLFLGQ